MIQNRKIKIVNWVIWLQFLVSLVVFVWLMSGGGGIFDILSLFFSQSPVRLTFRLDWLSVPILVMVQSLATMISVYSLRYLDQEKRQSYFYLFLWFTASSVSLMIISDNLLFYCFAWWMTSFGLHRLLLYYPQRPAAIEAARKKLIVSRIGDLALVFVVAWAYKVFGTMEFQKMFEMVSQSGFAIRHQESIAWLGFFLVLGAMAKSAQIPFHFWLPETMETPTPVSAIMHAGVINAGGYLVLRFSPLLESADWAHLALATMGAVSAVFGSLVMMTQTDIKKKLAYSTISQMGIMMFACGIGAYSIAFLHIIAHSYYKAHAFLSTGDLVKESKKIPLEYKKLTYSYLFSFVLLGLGILGFGLYWKEGHYLQYFTYGTVLGLSLLQSRVSLHSNATYRAGIRAAILISLAFLLLFFFGIESTVGAFTETMFGAIHLTTGLVLACFLGYLLFGMCFILTGLLIQTDRDRLLPLYIFLWNGGYFPLLTNRMLDWFWPAKELEEEIQGV